MVAGISYGKTWVTDLHLYFSWKTTDLQAPGSFCKNSLRQTRTYFGIQRDIYKSIQMNHITVLWLCFVYITNYISVLIIGCLITSFNATLYSLWAFLVKQFVLFSFWICQTSFSSHHVDSMQSYMVFNKRHCKPTPIKHLICIQINYKPKVPYKDAAFKTTVERQTPQQHTVTYWELRLLSASYA